MTKLTKKQRVFIDEYLICFNGAEAARRAGYSVRSAREIAVRLLAKDSIKAEIDQRLEEIHMSSEEAIKLLSEQARGDIGKVMDITSVGFSLDMKRAEEQGLTKLIKKVKQKTTTYLAKSESQDDREVTELEIELYDSQAAIDKILKVHGKYKNNLDITTNGNEFTIAVVYKDKNESRTDGNSS